MIPRVLRQAFTIRKSLLVVGVAVLGLALPAGALAKTEHIDTAGVMKAKGFKLSLNVLQGALTGYGGRNPNSVAGILKKKSGHATQVYNYAFNKGIKFKGSKNLGSATVKGTFAKGLGKIDMKFHATGKATRARVPKGCTGSPGKKRRGVFRGTYKLHANKLGTITVRSFRATLSSAVVSCNRSTHGYVLETFPSNKPYVQVSKASATGPVTESIEVSKGPGAWSFTYTYSVSREPSSDYKVGSKLSTAKVIGAGGIKGTATYSGSKSKNSFGKLKGTLRVTMAAIGPVSPFGSGTQGAEQKHHH